MGVAPDFGEELKTAITAEFADQIGVYSFKGGIDEPAITVDRANGESRPRPKVSGIEIVIEPDEDFYLDLFNGGSSQSSEIMRITLRQWDTKGIISPFAKTLMRRLHEYTLPDTYVHSSANQSVGSIEQVSFLVRFQTVYL